MALALKLTLRWSSRKVGARLTLAAGEVVVLEGMLSLYEGAKVRDISGNVEFVEAASPAPDAAEGGKSGKDGKDGKPAADKKSEGKK